MSKETYTSQDLAKHKRAQQMAYDAVEAVEKNLYEGITEKEAAAMIEAWLRDQGVSRFFHHGFAWFGDRTAFRGFDKVDDRFSLTSLLNPALPHFGKQFMPSNRKLKKGDAVILDVAPVVDGVAADIGYSCSLPGDESEKLHQARMDLEPYRQLILDLVLAEKTQAEIYKAVDKLIAEQGYENVHSYYPGGVLAHKVGKYPLADLPLPEIMGFDMQSLFYLGAHSIKEAIDGATNKSPLWGPHSHQPCEPGLWAVEPHIGKGPVGAKWEELLVVTENGAHWLTDDLPHVRYWKQHKKAAAPV